MTAAEPAVILQQRSASDAALCFGAYNLRHRRFMLLCSVISASYLLVIIIYCLSLCGVLQGNLVTVLSFLLHSGHIHQKKSRLNGWNPHAAGLTGVSLLQFGRTRELPEKLRTCL